MQFLLKSLCFVTCVSTWSRAESAAWSGTIIKLDKQVEMRTLVGELELVLHRLDAAGEALAAIYVSSAIDILNDGNESCAIDRASGSSLRPGLD